MCGLTLLFLSCSEASSRICSENIKHGFWYQASAELDDELIILRVVGARKHLNHARQGIKKH